MIHNSDPEGRDVSADAMFAALSDEHRRRIVRYLHDRPGETVDHEELARHLARQERAADDLQAEILCRHVHLPKLAECEIVEYDADAATARLVRDPRIESLLTIAADLGD